MDFTEDQKLAIKTKNCDLLVAAAAGSGKTAVLVERIIKTITNSERPVDIDKLLVVTFTEAAASEMHQKISTAISKVIDEEPDNEHFKRQLFLINRASISTIHSFCLSVIRQNFHLLDIDPNFRIADTTEIRLIKAEAVQELFEELYDLQDEDFLELVECYGGRVKDDGLQQLVLDIFEFTSANPDPHGWINQAVEAFELSGKSLDDTVWVKLIKESVMIKLQGAADGISRLLDKINFWEIPQEVLDMLQNDYSIVQMLIGSCTQGFDEMYRKFELCKEMYITFPRKKFNDEHKEYIKEFRDKEVKRVISSINESLFFKTPEKTIEELCLLYKTMKALGRLVMEFSERFKEIKKDKYIADFSDLEHFALRVLINKDTMEPTAEALLLREKYEEILIDEYQDSNMIQEMILSSVARKNPSNRFMVGDVKQSIYRFRLANPDLFREKYNTFSSHEGALEKRIDLSKNFRSRENILDGINFFFKQLMTEQVGEIAYDEKASLYYGATYYEDFKDKDELNIELHLIDAEGDDSEEAQPENEIEYIGKVELEAKIIADKIKAIVGNMEIGGRKAEYKDIVILVRSVTSVAEIYVNQLKDSDIPAFANVSGGYFESAEVATVLSFLQVIDNPRQDIHLITVLHSPVYKVTCDELTYVRGAMSGGTFYDCMTACLNGNYPADAEIMSKLEKFSRQLNRWRDIALHTPIDEILWDIYEQTEYYNYVGAYHGGVIRQANLTTLVERAVQYGKTSYKGLFHFIRYIEKLQKSGDKAGDANVLSDNENLVRIMTIHKSKGLEFPIVFVSGLGKQFNMQDAAQKLLLHSKYGFGPKYIDYENRIQYDTIPRRALAGEILKENLSEELRVLYVALTRAKEKLILTGTVSDMTKHIKKWSTYIEYEKKELPPHYMLKAKTYLDWIVPAVLRHRDGQPMWKDDFMSYNKELFNDGSHFKIIVKTKRDIAGVEEKELMENKLRFERLKELHGDKSSNYDRIAEILGWEYTHKLETFLPSKISVSEIKRLYYNETLADSQRLEHINMERRRVFETPTFLMEGEEKYTSTQRGTILHTVLEHLDLNVHTTKESLIVLLELLVMKNILTVQDTETVSLDKILRFVQSDLANRIRKSTFVKKEIPFVIELKPYEIYNDPSYESIQDTILVHGIMDMIFSEDDSIVLVDYKTDSIKDGTAEIERLYRRQLEIYKRAIVSGFNMPVKQCLLYLFGNDSVLEVEV